MLARTAARWGTPRDSRAPSLASDGARTRTRESRDGRTPHATSSPRRCHGRAALALVDRERRGETTSQPPWTGRPQGGDGLRGHGAPRTSRRQRRPSTNTRGPATRAGMRSWPTIILAADHEANLPARRRMDAVWVATGRRGPGCDPIPTASTPRSSSSEIKVLVRCRSTSSMRRSRRFEGTPGPWHSYAHCCSPFWRWPWPSPRPRRARWLGIPRRLIASPRTPCGRRPTRNPCVPCRPPAPRKPPVTQGFTPVPRRCRPRPRATTDVPAIGTARRARPARRRVARSAAKSLCRPRRGSARPWITPRPTAS